MRSTSQPWYGIYKHRGQYWYATAHTGLGSVVGAVNGEYSLDCFTNGVDDLSSMVDEMFKTIYRYSDNGCVWLRR